MSQTDGLQRQHRIAVIGAGLAGTSMASMLSTAGYKNLVLFEAEPSIDASQSAIVPLVRFGTRINEVHYQTSGPAWNLVATNGETYEADVVVSTIWPPSGEVDFGSQPPSHGWRSRLFYLRNPDEAPVIELVAPPMSIVGRNEVSLAEAWRGGPMTYLGIVSPGFPNLFLVAQVNEGDGAGVHLNESQGRFVLAALAALDRRGADEVEVSRAVATAAMDEFKSLSFSTSYWWKCRRFSSKAFSFGQRSQKR